MRQQLIALFSILLVFAAVSGSVCHLVLSPGRRSILSVSDEITTSLVATLNGTINFVDLKSEKVLWSFATGAPIYSSHHNASGPGALYYIECGDDWMLYAHTEVGTRKLDGTVRGIVNTTPHIMEGVGVMNGAMKTVVFLLDANTGRLIHMYGANESEQSGSINLKTDEPLLHITRTDYFLWFASKAYTWNMTISEIGAVFLCQDIENSISGALVGNMPLPCQSKAVVARLRSDNVSDYFSRPNRQEALELPEYGIRSLAESDADPTKLKIFDAEPTKLKIFDAEPTKLKIFDAEPTKSKISGQDVKISSRGVFSVISFVLVVVVILIYFGAPLRQGSVNNLSAKNVSSKRKKNRKSGKNGGSVEKKDKKSLSELEDGYSLIESDKLFMNFNQPRDGCKDGHTIGKLFVTNKEIAKGSNGTIVLEGIYEGRPVAVKRLVRAHHDVAFKEIQNLIASDRHSNIVRWYGVEYDQNFVYLSLERCTCSLNDIVQLYSDHSEKTEYTGAQASKAMIEYKVRLDSTKDILQDIELWKANGYPSPMLLKLMRDVVSGLAHLHELGIIHRDLKPQNVLIIKGKSLTAKLSDMGISKRLVGDMSSLGHHATGHGSSGWQAPEQLLHGRQTRAVDMFSLGCVLFYCITGGRHPFGDHLERDINITKNLVDLFLVEHIPEAVDLFSCLLDPKSELRPKALDVLHHPFFWTSEMRLSFLHDTSDRVELEDRVVNSDILKALESVAPVALGGKWNEKMEPAFLADIGQYRRYKFESVRDLLRVMRNKLNHYRELPQHIKELLGAVPEGFDDYFGSRFPKLLIEVYKVMYKFSKDEEWFRKYSSSDKV